MPTAQPVPSNQVPGLPKLSDIVPGGGLAGCDYLHVALVNVPRAERLGFKMITKSTYEVNGQPAMLMYHGKPVPGGRHGSMLPSVAVDSALLASLDVPAAEAPPAAKPPKADTNTSARTGNTPQTAK